MKCQILFAGKNRKYIINLSSAELAHSVVKVKWNFYYGLNAAKIIIFQQNFLNCLKFTFNVNLSVEVLRPN